MDISEMIVGGGNKTIPPNDDHETPHDLDPADDTTIEEFDMPAAAGEMTAVERIRAYRNGTLTPPMVGNPDESGDSAGDDDNDVARPGADIPESDVGGAENDAPEPQAAHIGDDQPATADKGSRRFGVPRKALIIAVPAAALLVAGVAIPSMSGNDKTAADTAVVSQSAAGSLTPTSAAPVPAVIPDGVITPAKVEAAEYPISLTPPMDAFSGDKGKAWVSAGLDGTVLTITLPAPMIVTEIGVVPGFDSQDKDGADLWAKHRIVTSMAYNLDYGPPVYAEYANKRERQTTPFGSPDHPAVTQTIRMVILGTQDVSSEAPPTGSESNSPAPAPGLLGDLGPLSLGPTQAAPSPDNSRPATFAIGSIEIIGHSPAR